MNTARIQRLSEQCCALETFRDRCTWVDADFSVGNYSLASGTSALISIDIQGICRERIKLLKEAIKIEAAR